jgi:hypothetical protein
MDHVADVVAMGLGEGNSLRANGFLQARVAMQQPQILAPGIAGAKPRPAAITTFWWSSMPCHRAVTPQLSRLQEDLQALLGAPVDLIVERAIRNPYFRQSVQALRHELYAA